MEQTNLKKTRNVKNAEKYEWKNRKTVGLIQNEECARISS